MSDLIPIPFDLQMAGLAARLEQCAADTRTRYVQLAAAVDSCQWDGPAARAFRRSNADLVATMRLGVQRLEAAAEAVRRHSATVTRLAEEQQRLAVEQQRERAQMLLRLLKKVGID